MDQPGSESLQATIDALMASLEEAKIALEPIASEVTQLNADEHQVKQAFNEQMRILAEKKRIAMSKQQTVLWAKTQAENELQAAKQKAAQEAAEIAKDKAEKERIERETANYALLGKRFENAAMGAPWRERAKDHQIEAGRKIAVDRKVILADVMGLGKTLSSVILADMVEKATRDVNPDFPILGEEVTQHVPPQKVWSQLAIDCYNTNEYPFGSGPLQARMSIIPSVMPFDDDIVMCSGKPFRVGAEVPYIPYDFNQKLIEQGIIEVTPASTKTAIIDAIERPVGRRVLYFCPSPLLRNVMEEWSEWSPHRNVTYIGGMSKGERDFALSFLPKLDDYVIIVNYEAWRRDLALLDSLAACKFDTVIIDEAHMIKDMKSQAYRGVRKVLDECNPEYIIPMTGTPILNRPQEFYTLLTLVDPKKYTPDASGEKSFLWRYCEEYTIGDSEVIKYRFKEGGIDQLIKQISKNILRRTKDQAGIILPDKTVITHDLDRDDEAYPDQALAREHMKKFATIVINEQEGKAIQATIIIAMITRLRQIETWPAGIIQRDKITKEIIVQLDVEESQKIDYTIRFDESSQEWEGLIPDTIDNERMVVFSQFKAPLQELKRRIELMGKTCVVIDGDTSPAVRDEARLDFDRNHTPDRSKARWDVALCNYKAAGVGLNLTAATSMVILDQEWNPGKRDQAYDRLHRMGQTENVTINVLNVKNTIDQWLEDIMQSKESDAKGLDTAMVTASDLVNAIESGLI